MDVCLINMPFAHLAAPSIGLGLLQATLRDRGLSSTSVYANFDFAETIGLPAYIGVCDTLIEDMLGEWVFADAAFPEYASDERAYVRELQSRASWLRQFGEEDLCASLLDLRRAAGAFVGRLAEALVERGPRIIGCTSMFRQHVASLALLRRVRALEPGIITMLGGANCETVMGRTTHERFCWVDYVVSGEADGFFADFCSTLLEDGPPPPERLPVGVFAPPHRQAGYPGDGQLVGEPPRATNRDVAGLPVPCYDDFFAALEQSPLRRRIHPRLLYEASRGCWWGEKQHCIFCGLNGSTMTYRSKPDVKVLNDLEQLSQRHGVRQYQFVDNIFDTRYFDSLLPRLAQVAEPFQICHEIKPNLRRDQIRQFQAAGIVQLLLGIESLHSEHLKLMRKGCQAWQNLQTLKWCREFGVWCSWNMLYDFPGERDEWFAEMANWLPWIAHLKPPTWEFLIKVRLDRYSPMQSRPEEYGLRIQPCTPYRFVFPLGERDLARQAYYFESQEDEGVPRSAHGCPAPDRPGAWQVQHLLHDWYARFFGDSAPVFTMRIDREQIDLYDTRPAALTERATLEGIEREICLLADEALPRQQLISRLESAGRERGRIEAALERMREHGWVVELDGRLVGLAIRSADDRLPPVHEIPGGYVDCPTRSLVPGAVVVNMVT